MHALLTMFCLRFKSSVPSRRKYLIHFAIALLCENEVIPTSEIIDEKHKDLLATVLMKKNIIYQQIKRNEKSDDHNAVVVEESMTTNKIPMTSNLKDTLRKLEILQDF